MLEVKHCTVFVNSITTYTGTRAIWPFPLEGDTKICLFLPVSILYAKYWGKRGGGLPFLPAVSALRALTPTQPHHPFTQHPPSPAPSTPHLLPVSSHLHQQTLPASSPHPSPPCSRSVPPLHSSGPHSGPLTSIWLETPPLWSPSPSLCLETELQETWSSSSQ